MARNRTPVVIRALAIEELLAYPEFRKRAIDAILYLLEVGNETDEKREGTRSRAGQASENQHAQR